MCTTAVAKRRRRRSQLMVNRRGRLSTYDRRDPTRTTVIRNRFAGEATRRFRRLRGIIREAIVDKDVFGLSDADNRGLQGNQVQSNVQARQFDFPRSDRKIEAFMNWLSDQIDDGILEIGERRELGQAVSAQWQNLYIEDSYKRGVQRATYEMRRTDIPVPSIQERGGLQAVMTAPAHLDRLGLLYTRTFNELKGITNAMEQQVSRILAQGLADGDGPRLLARKLNATISGKGLGDLGITDSLGRFIPAERRAQILARTEVIRAHHGGMMQTYRNWGAEGIEIMAEFRTAEDSRVCEQCASLQGNFYTIEEAENLIPVHPWCRCIALPARREDVEQAGKEFKTEGTTVPAQATPADPTPTPNPISTPDLTDAIESASTKADLERVMTEMGFNSASFTGIPLELGKKITRAANWTVQNIGDMNSPIDFSTTASKKFLGIFRQKASSRGVGAGQVRMNSELQFSRYGQKTSEVEFMLDHIADHSGRTGWHYKGVTPESTMAHELGHYFTYLSQQRKYFRGEIDADNLVVGRNSFTDFRRDWSRKEHAREIVNEALENIGEEPAYIISDVYPTLGEYAETNLHEVIAMSVQHAFDKPGEFPFADEIVNVLRRRISE